MSHSQIYLYSNKYFKQTLHVLLFDHVFSLQSYADMSFDANSSLVNAPSTSNQDYPPTAHSTPVKIIAKKPRGVHNLKTTWNLQLENHVEV